MFFVYAVCECAKQPFTVNACIAQWRLDHTKYTITSQIILAFIHTCMVLQTTTAHSILFDRMRHECGFDYIFDFDGVLWRTREMLVQLGEALHAQGALVSSHGISPLYHAWKHVPKEHRGTFTEGFPRYLAQAGFLQGNRKDAALLADIVRDVSSRNWIHPRAHEVLAQLPQERVFLVTCGDGKVQQKKLEISGLMGSVLDWSRIQIVPRKDEAAFLRACTEMGVVGPIIHINDRLDELWQGHRAFPDGIPVWVGERTGEEYGGRGKETEHLFGISSESVPSSLIHISDLGELPGALQERGLL